MRSFSLTRRRRQKAHVDDKLASYEEKPRSRKIFSERLRQEFKLPIILSTGEKVLPRNNKNALETPQVNVESVCRRKKLKEQFLKKKNGATDINHGSKAQIQAKKKLRQQANDTSVTGLPDSLKNNKQIETREIKRILQRPKLWMDVLTEIATACELVMCDPYQNVYLLKLLLLVIHGKWDHINPCSSSENDLHVVKNKPSILAMLSMGAALQNCLVGYQLRPDMKSNTLSSHTTSIKLYETRFIKVYTAYIDILEKWFHQCPNFVIPVVSGLLLCSPYFNNSDQLLRMILLAGAFVSDAPSKESSVASTTAIECVKTLLEQDASFNMTLRLLYELNKLIKSMLSQKKKAPCLKGDFLYNLANIRFADKEAMVSREESIRGTCNVSHMNTQVYQRLMQSSIYGDIHSFRQKKVKVIQELCVLFLRVLQEARHYSVETVEACIESLGLMSHNIPAELLVDILNELKRLAEVEGPQLGHGIMFTAIANGVRVSLILTQKMNFQTDTTWITPLLTQAIYLALPCFTSNSAYLSVLEPPIEVFSGRRVCSLGKEVHSDDKSVFLNRFENSFSVIRKNTSVFDITSTAFTKELIELIQCLLTSACQIADPLCRYALLKLVKDYLKKYPTLSSILDEAGVVLYGTGEEVTVFWELHLLNTWGVHMDEGIPLS